MARPLRIEYEGAFYHVTSRGNERRKIYFSKSDYQKFKEYVAEAMEKYNCLIHSYVFMSNHYHLLLETRRANLSKVMHYINGSYTTYTNIERKRSGHLFQGRYKGIVIERDQYLLELSRYIHLNPVRAGIVESPEEYTYSSYRSYITREKDKMINRELLLGMLSGSKGDVRKRYRTYVERGIGEKLENPLKKVYGGMILGRGSFIKETLRRIKEEDWRRDEVSHRRAFNATWKIEDILGMVSKELKVKRSELTKSKTGENKKLAIYLLKRHTGATNRQIGEIFGGISYSAITKVYQRFSMQVVEDRELGKRVSKIEKKMSHVKG